MNEQAARRAILEGIDAYGNPKALRMFGPARPECKWSTGNDKIGAMLNLSLAPGLTCPDCSSCYRDCYARRPYMQYPNAAYRWNCNTLAFEVDAHRAAVDLAESIPANTALARLLVSGDARTQSYVNAFHALAESAPAVRFYLYTKTTNIHDWTARADNLAVLHSQWPGRDVTGRHLEVDGPVRRAWIVGDPRCPSDAIVCPATFPSKAAKAAHKAAGRPVITCAECGACPYAEQDIAFHLH